MCCIVKHPASILSGGQPQVGDGDGLPDHLVGRGLVREAQDGHETETAQEP